MMLKPLIPLAIGIGAVGLDNSTINNLALLGLAALQAWSMYQSKRNHESGQQKIVEVKEETKEIKTLVNAPMGVALGAAASALEQVARMSHQGEDATAAFNARKASNEHNAAQAILDAQKLDVELSKKKIIADYEAGKNLPVEGA